MKQLFKSHELLLSFNKFLPKGFEILFPFKEFLRKEKKVEFGDAMRYIKKIKVIWNIIIYFDDRLYGVN